MPRGIETWRGKAVGATTQCLGCATSQPHARARRRADAVTRPGGQAKACERRTTWPRWT